MEKIIVWYLIINAVAPSFAERVVTNQFGPFATEAKCIEAAEKMKTGYPYNRYPAGRYLCLEGVVASITR